MRKLRSPKRTSPASTLSSRSSLLAGIQAATEGFDRISMIALGVILLTGLIVARLFDLQVLQHAFYEALAQDQHQIQKELLPERGEIFVQDHGGDPKSEAVHYPIASNHELLLVYANPKRVQNPEETTKQLMTVLELDYDTIVKRLSKGSQGDMYEPIQHQVPYELAEKVTELKLEGVDVLPEPARNYADPFSMAHLTGFLSMKDEERKGQYGIEQQFDQELAGKPGFLKAERSAGGQIIGIGERIVTEAQDGVDVVLTIERAVQYKACAELEEAVDTFDAAGGEVVVMEPTTGRILAMCSYPVFDPNHYSDVEDVAVFTNRAISSTYEPGSVFKPFTMAAALNEGAVTPETTFSDSGVEVIAGYPIRNFDDRVWGTQTMTGALEFSINTGMIFAMRTIGPEKFYEYLQRFGFEEKTGLDLPGEAAGSLGELSTGKEVFAATASFGQGVTTTALQLTAAYAAIANGGKLVKPQIVDAFLFPNGFVRSVEPEVTRQVISPKTSKTLSAMLASVVENGQAKRAQIPGYYVGGKTGTAQIASASGGYDPNQTNHTFSGFFPVSDPKIVVTVHLERPSAAPVAAATVSATFAKIGAFLVDYYQIPQDHLEEQP